MAQYLKQDSELGYIEDNAEIEQLKFNNLRHVILGCMLGDFDETGAYVVDPEVVKELVAMKKFVADTYDNIEICRGELKLDKQITFMVTFEGNKATLSLLEKLSYEANFKINSGTYSNINEYVLDQIETTGEVNRNVVYDRWNIDVYGGNVVDIFSCDESVLEKYFGLVNRFKYLLEANKIFLEKEEVIEEIEAGYANEMFEVLKRYPKLNEAVSKQIKETLTDKKNLVSVTKPNFAKTFNEILENAIKSNLDVVDIKEKEEFEKEQRNVILNSNIKKVEVLEIEHLKVEEKKELSPTVLQVKTNSTYTSKSVQELGEEFVVSHQKVSNRVKNTDIKAPVEKTDNPESEKNKLIATLVGAGLGAMIGGVAGAVVGAVAGAVVADTAEQVKQAAEVKKPAAKKAEVKTPAAKKPAAKKAEVKTPAAKKPVAKKTEAKNSTAKKPTAKTPVTSTKSSAGKPLKATQEQNDEQENKLADVYANRLLSQMVGNKEQKKTENLVATTLSAEEMIKMEEVIAKQTLKNTQLNTVIKQDLKGGKQNKKVVVEKTSMVEETIITDLF